VLINEIFINSLLAVVKVVIFHEINKFSKHNFVHFINFYHKLLYIPVYIKLHFFILNFANITIGSLFNILGLSDKILTYQDKLIILKSV